MHDLDLTAGQSMAGIFFMMKKTQIPPTSLRSSGRKKPGVGSRQAQALEKRLLALVECLFAAAVLFLMGTVAYQAMIPFTINYSSLMAWMM